MSEQHTPAANGAANGTAGSEATGSSNSGPDWQGFLEGLDKLGAKLDGIQGTVAEGTRPPPPPEPDLGTMTNSELHQHIMGSVGKVVQETVMSALKPLMDQVNGVQTDLITTKGQLALDAAKAKHKDLVDWKDEMVGLAKKHPSMDLNEVYVLARAQNPEKAAALDLRYNPPPPKPRPFGGLVPSSGSSPAEPRLSGIDATRAAYREVQDRTPGILPLLNEL